MSKITTRELVELVDDNRLIEVRTKEDFKSYLNNDPPAQWVKKHPIASSVNYLPIDKVEVLLDAIFQDWQVEVKSVSQLAQSICAIVRLHYRHPVNGEWLFHDGVGATPLKTDKGFSAADLSHIKSDAVSTGAPAAVSFAIKDAAEHIGNIFGRNLNRKDTINLGGIYEHTTIDEQTVDAIDKIQNAKTMIELKEIWGAIKPVLRASKEVFTAKEKRKEQLSESA